LSSRHLLPRFPPIAAAITFTQGQCTPTFVSGAFRRSEHSVNSTTENPGGSGVISRPSVHLPTTRTCSGLIAVAATILLFAPGVAHSEDVELVPPKGIAVPDADRRSLEDGLTSLGQEIRKLRADPQAAA